MTLTDDQYVGITKLSAWYNKASHQFLELSGVIGTGMWELVEMFIDEMELDKQEVMYLTYNQKQMLELAHAGYHAYYINGVLYKYRCYTNLDTLPVVNPLTSEIKRIWKKEKRSKINSDYRLIVVFDSVLLSEQTISDLSSFGLPVLLLRDPMLLPAPESHTFSRKPNVVLGEINPDYASDPIVYLSQRAIEGKRFELGSYDTVNIFPRKQLNLHNLRSADMIITLSEQVRREMNALYREKVCKCKNTENIVGERLIVMESIHREVLKNPDNGKVKVYFTKGLIGTISSIYKHRESTRYVPMEFLPEGYHESFTDISLDRFHLNNTFDKSGQQLPDEILISEYAYALTPSLARLCHWDKIVIIVDDIHSDDPALYRRLLYTAVTRGKQNLTVIV